MRDLRSALTDCFIRGHLTAEQLATTLAALNRPERAEDVAPPEGLVRARDALRRIQRLAD